MENVKSVAESFKNAGFLIKTGQKKSMKKVSQIFFNGTVFHELLQKF